MQAVILLILVWMPVQEEAIEVEAEFVMRRDLPEGFPWQTQDKGYAVLRLKIANSGDSPWDFDPDAVSVRNPKGKRLEAAEPEEITPKILKYYRGTQGAVNGQLYGGLPPEYQRRRSGPDPNRPPLEPSVLSLDTVKLLRDSLEHFELDAGPVAPGEALEGFLYFKSKHSGRRLAGSTVVLGDGTEIVVP